jgi:glycine hydroxymethyltransferase
VAAGEFPSPIGYADVVSLTTHKTLCGPRGAIIITTDRVRAKDIDMGVFPGEQGGPHIHQIAAKAVAFGLAQTETFRTLMRTVKANALSFAEELMRLGVKVQGGGTESHLFLVDLKGTRKDSGVPLYGDIAANILDLCNITANKNTIPGDEAAAYPTGIRIGTTLVSQQGYGPDHMKTIAGLFHRVIDTARTFTVTTGGGVRGRARVPFDVMADVREAVARLTNAVAPDTPERRPAHPETSGLEVRGERAGVFLQDILTTDVLALRPGEGQRSLMLDSAGDVLTEIEVRRAKARDGHDRYHLLCSSAAAVQVEDWLRGLTDGYLDFDEDLTRKIDGPVALERLREEMTPTGDPLPEPEAAANRVSASERLASAPELFTLEKPWFIGHAALDRLPPEETASWIPFEPAPGESLRKTPVNALHRKLTDARNMVPFAGWDMPVLYSSIRDEHRAVRETAGLFDVAHMGTMDVRGEGAARFLDLLTTNFVWRLIPGQSQYTYVLRPDGSVMDDLLVYMRAPEDYMVVANAANAEEVLDHLRRTAAGDTPLSLERPWVRPDALPRIRDLRDPAEAGDDMLVDLSLQGPLSTETLLRFAAGDEVARGKIASLQKSELARVSVNAYDLIVSYTGYTGEERGYEIFVHPDRAADLFADLLEAGADLGVVPTGLGARDSLRCEAGFPLHGHELAGPHHILPAEAGYAPFVKEHKPFFVGREPHLASARSSKRQIARVRLERSGIRMVQPGDPIANARGQIVGCVTSAVLPGDHQIALVLADQATSRVGNRIVVYGKPRKKTKDGYKPVEALSPGDAVPVGEAAEVIERFPATSDEDQTCGTS